MTASKIEWTDRSDWNPIRGCTRVSEGCVNCYAEAMAARFSNPGMWGHGFAEMKSGKPRWTGKVELQEDRLTLPLTWKKPTADTRIPHLLATPAAIRFLSCEPLLGPIDITAIRRTRAEGFMRPLDGRFNTISWVIAGGESGPHARPMHPDWARSLRDQCAAAGVPFFFKQWGEWQIGMPIESGKRGRFAIHWPGEEWKYFEETPRHIDRFGLDASMTRLGKKNAGRKLDGVEHSQFPEARG
jgi:protein gp37